MYSLFFFVYLYCQSENIAVTCPKHTWEFRKKRLLYYLLLYFHPWKRCFSLFLTKNSKFLGDLPPEPLPGLCPWPTGGLTEPPPDPQLMFYMPSAHSFFALQKTDAPIFFLYYPLVVEHAMHGSKQSAKDLISRYNWLSKYIVGFIISYFHKFW